MSAVGAPLGNQNAKQGKLWRDTLRRALLAEDGKKLRAIADALVAKAAEGDVSAIKEIGDRLDGKSVQGLEMSGPEGGPINASITVGILPVRANTDG